MVDAQNRQPWLNGMELLADSLQNKHVLSTGCEWYIILLTTTQNYNNNNLFIYF